MKPLLFLCFCLILADCDVPGSFKHDNIHDPLSAKYEPYSVNQVTATIVSNHAIHLQWETANAKGDTFQIGRTFLPSGGFKKIAEITYAGGPGSYTDTISLQGGSELQYRVKTTRGNSESSFVLSNIVRYNPKKPDSLKIQGINKTSARFSWQSANAFPTTYRVAYKRNEDDAYKVIESNYPDTSIVITGLDPTKEYTLKVNISGNSNSGNDSNISISYHPGFVQDQVFRQINSSYIIGDFVYINDGRDIAAVYSNGILEIINSTTKKVEKSLQLGQIYPGANFRYYHLVTNKNGSIFAVSLLDQQIFVLTSRGQIIKTFHSASPSATGPARLIALTATGDTLIYESNTHNYLNIVNTRTGNFLAKIPISYKYSKAVCISHNDKYLAIATGDSVNIWSMSPLEKLSMGFGGSNDDSFSLEINYVQFSPDDSRLYISKYAGVYNMLYMCDFTPSSGLTNLEQVGSGSQNFLYEPTSVTAIPQSKLIIVSSWLDIISPGLYLVDSSTNSVVAVYKKRKTAAKAIYSSDGKHVLCSFKNKIIDFILVESWYPVWDGY